MTRAQRIYDALSHALTPDTFMIDDESSQHNVPVGSETHFKLVVVATAFKGLSRIERHRVVNKHLQSEFTTGLHALSLFLYTPEEWGKRQTSVPASPACRDGRRHDKA